eukprot:CAMPEP_0168315092 /NCGR_PEP_ID=MMETSP0210-20121227/10107_1 /TAXON_ID=40633 /ORGANISM="Condylostoma magnum, Strain COL2" /LENGTH=61 /DNA_ID=CAMNT_0008286327 /DNA_START=1743 /DNA_END=1928 /DNA_ORIENTATION=+
MRGLIHGTGCSYMIDKETNLNIENDNNKKARNFLEDSFRDEDSIQKPKIVPHNEYQPPEPV